MPTLEELPDDLLLCIIHKIVYENNEFDKINRMKSVCSAVNKKIACLKSINKKFNTLMRPYSFLDHVSIMEYQKCQKYKKRPNSKINKSRLFYIHNLNSDTIQNHNFKLNDDAIIGFHYCFTKKSPIPKQLVSFFDLLNGTTIKRLELDLESFNYQTDRRIQSMDLTCSQIQQLVIFNSKLSLTSFHLYFPQTLDTLYLSNCKNVFFNNTSTLHTLYLNETKLNTQNVNGLAKIYNCILRYSILDIGNGMHIKYLTKDISSKINTDRSLSVFDAYSCLNYRIDGLSIAKNNECQTLYHNVHKYPELKTLYIELYSDIVLNEFLFNTLFFRLNHLTLCLMNDNINIINKHLSKLNTLETIDIKVYHNEYKMKSSLPICLEKQIFHSKIFKYELLVTDDDKHKADVHLPIFKNKVDELVLNNCNINISNSATIKNFCIKNCKINYINTNCSYCIDSVSIHQMNIAPELYILLNWCKDLTLYNCRSSNGGMLFVKHIFNHTNHIETLYFSYNPLCIINFKNAIYPPSLHKIITRKTECMYLQRSPKYHIVDYS